MTAFCFSRVSSKWSLVALVVLLFQSCEIPPEVRVQPTNPPTFIFSSGTRVDMLLVYHLSHDQPDKGVFLDAVLEDKPNIFWMVEGNHDQRLPINYGIVPKSMKETVPAKALIEGEYYLVLVGSLANTRFTIRDGVAQPLK